MTDLLQKLTPGKPISPDQIGAAKISVIPPAIIDVFNRLIASNFSAGSALVLQEDVCKMIANECQIERNLLFEKGYLNVEEVFQEAGWKVQYYKPAYNESGDAYFIFSTTVKR